ncbi:MULTISPECIES: adenine deaminase [unclassified Ruminococcus]|uniref:adenine deaminase n=1 Tax=unclassified Ruminococcus TaxID=2608920 RepID=UPI00210B3E11|nr:MULTISPECIES: adenine deaminase [unclassified Ruminococcus]MCQ4022659.1 adenine deaminase [Ruminococcus sp. zg-924]MCQ4114899.1 adenine deaminase [Ruminococcus sp. zg-921]
MNNIEKRKQLIETAAGRRKAELVFKNVKYLNVFTNEFVTADVAVAGGFIAGIGEYNGEKELDCTGKSLVPGFIDSHIHLESSIVSPKSFAQAVSAHGTTAVVTDPHEITNVLGTNGINYMLSATENLPIDVFFVVPSCVPSSPFDENGAVINHCDTEQYMKNPRVLGLAEMMNFPATIGGDEEIIKMILSAENEGKAVDGHAPGLSGKSLNAYVAAGVMSDHECTTTQEALEKLSIGQYIMIRQGTASKNLDELTSLLKADTCSRCLFATDDKHPGELVSSGHIDYIIKKAIEGGVKAEIAYKVASFNSAQYFNLPKRGAVAPGYIADLVLLDDINSVGIDSVYKNGVKLEPFAEIPSAKIDSKLDYLARHTMNTAKITADLLRIKNSTKVIGLISGQIVTADEGEASGIDVANDILKVCVVERHKNTGHIGVCYIKGYGLKSGAVATSIAHDSHNIIAVGTNDSDIAAAVNGIIDMCGGMIVINNQEIVESLELDIAGLMTDKPINQVAENIAQLKGAAYSLGVNTNIDPFMTLSFVSLPVIPHIKLTSLGVVDVDKFELIK